MTDPGESTSAASSDTGSPGRQHQWALLVLAGTLATGYGVLFTLVGDYKVNYGLSESVLGLILGAGFIIAFISQTVLGPLGDRGHARSLIAAGIVLNIAGLLLMGFGTTGIVIFTGRALSGLATGAAIPAIRRVLIVGSGSDIGRNLGLLLSVEVFGFALGPVISAILAGPFGLGAPFIAISIFNAAIGIFVMMSVTVPEGVAGSASRFAFDLLGDRAFAGAVLLGAAAFVMIGAFDVLWDLVHTDLGTNEWLANLGITLFAIPLVLLGPTAGKLAQHAGPFRVAAIGMAAGALFMGMYGFAASGVIIFWITMVHAISDGLTFAASGVAVGLVAPEQRQAGAQGVLGGMQALAAGIVSVITGWVYEHHGQRSAYLLAAVLIASMAAAGFVLAGPARHTTTNNVATDRA